MQRFGTVAIVGVGLIGGSIGLALRARGLADRVVGIGRDDGRLEEARALGAIDYGSSDVGLVAEDAEVVVVCTPSDRIAADVCRVAALAGPDVLITDVGSTKGRIVKAVEEDEKACRVFVAAHPLAGSERRGAASARADLLDGRVCVLTPTDRTPVDRCVRARQFWSSIGCRVAVLDPETHDAALARTSHLPHVVASALALSVPPEALELAAGAYRDGTRVAASDPDLWVAIFRENRDQVIEALDEYRGHLDRFRSALMDDDPVALGSLWSRGRSLRLRFKEPGSG